jgi:putative iron-regulated protein
MPVRLRPIQTRRGDRASWSQAAAIALPCLVFLAAPAQSATTPEVARTYADIALAAYTDSLTTARTLDAAIRALVEAPSEETMDAARQAWLAARVPYQQTEVYRFGNPLVDEWEGRVNAWPLDEGLIDYVDASYGTENDANELYTLNVIANPQIIINGVPVDASNITPDFLRDTLAEAGDVETNVATGYHAIEFLLWGQDLNGTGPGAGERPYTDYDLENCTNGNCDRRADYLLAASELLLSDLEEMVGHWEEGGGARSRVTEGNGTTGVASLLTGMGSLSYGELAGERMKLGLMLHDPEEEHDCFSDNTANSHYYNVVGIQNVFLGRYRTVAGDIVEGPSLRALVAAADPAVADELAEKIEFTLAAVTALKERADTVEAYDQMLAEGNTEGNAAIQVVIDALVDQVPSIERAVSALSLGKITFEGSDSLDKPAEIFR